MDLLSDSPEVSGTGRQVFGVCCFSQILGRKQTNAKAEFLELWSSNHVDQNAMEGLVKKADSEFFSQIP